MRRRSLTLVAAFLVCLAGLLAAQPVPSPTPTPLALPTPAPTPPPMIDLRFVRYKISAGDLPSAESILEVHRAEKGEDAEYLLSVAWVARGAALLGDWPAAERYAKAARELAMKKLGAPADYANNAEATYALGTAIEVDAQALVAAGKRAEALRFLKEAAQAQEKAPYNLRARIEKRRNQIELVGQSAPEIQAEDHLGAASPTLASLRGKPVVLFLWWESCGDCKAQAAALKKTVEKYSGKDVAFLAVTRYYDPPAERSAERTRIEKAWKEVYDLPASVAVPISDQAMLRYGVSATPTFVFIDKKGVVRRYLPFRLTQERLSQEIDELLR